MYVGSFGTLVYYSAMASNQGQSVTVNVGALSNALAVAIQQATTSSSTSGFATAGPSSAHGSSTSGHGSPSMQSPPPSEAGSCTRSYNVT